jgi:hypothetical protein
MSVKGYIDTLLNALDVNLRYPIRSAFYYEHDNWKIGSGVRAENAQWYIKTGITSSVANTEFSFAHGLGSAPKWLIPVLDLQSVNSQIVPLQVSRAADASRVYLKSTSTSAGFTCLLEP